METGEIVRVVGDKGYGFIQRGDQWKDIFFHASQLRGGLFFSEDLVGTRVQFRTEEGPKGLAAVDVTKV